MYQTSAAFAAEVRKSHTPAIKVDVHTPLGPVVASTEKNLYMTDGSVTLDRNNAIRGHMELTLIDTTGALVPLKGPKSKSEILNPMNFFQFKPYRGVKYADGTTEYVPLGTYYISDLSIEPNEAGGFTTIKLSLDDGAKVLSRRRLNVPWTNNGAGLIQLWIESFFFVVAPYWMGGGLNTNMIQTNFNFGSTANTAAILYMWKVAVTDDPWQQLQNMANGIGMDLYFGRLGEMNLFTVFDPDDVPLAASYDEGTGGVFVKPPSRRVSLDDAVTGVRVRSTAPWLIYPVFAEIWDLDQRSLTYAGSVLPSQVDTGDSNLGRIAYEVEDAHVTNVTAAQAAARKFFIQKVGILENIAFDILPDPRLDPGDVIYINSTSSGTEGRYALESVTIPLTYDGTMTATTRRRRRV